MYRLNLLPKEILERRKNKKLKLICIILFIIIIIFCLICYKWICYETIKITREIKNNLSNSPTYISTSSYDDEKITTYINQNKVVLDEYQDIKEGDKDWSDLISRILRCVSNEITLNFLSITEDNYLIIKGSSLETVFIAEIIKNLENIDIIEKANLDLIIHDNNLYRYEISAIIKSF